MFVYQPTLDTLELKEDRGTGYVINKNSKGVYSSKLTPLYTAFLCNVKLAGYRIKIRFSNRVLIEEQNNHVTKIANASLVFDLET